MDLHSSVEHKHDKNVALSLLDVEISNCLRLLPMFFTFYVVVRQSQYQKINILVSNYDYIIDKALQNSIQAEEEG